MGPGRPVRILRRNSWSFEIKTDLELGSGRPLSFALEMCFKVPRFFENVCERPGNWVDCRDTSKWHRFRPKRKKGSRATADSLDSELVTKCPKSQRFQVNHLPRKPLCIQLTENI